MTEAVGEVTDLLQHLIRNQCVNDGTPASGQEVRNADVLRSYLEGAGLDLEWFEPLPGRASVVTRIEGSDPAAPSLMLMGHTDVVPVNAERWRRDPFGGELVDGEVWGRGAVDMLNLTASMAVAVRRLADSGFHPRGTLVYLAEADEESLGTHGAQWLTEHAHDAVRTDYVITESGGVRLPLPTPGPRLSALVAEKGSYWCTLRIRGTPGHASMPLRTDNALVKAAEVIRRVAAYEPPADVHETWRRFVRGLELPEDIAGTLLDPGRILEFCRTFPDLGLARMAHACTHTTFAPTVVAGGVKTNVIPDTVDVQVDIRTLPGQTAQDVRAMLAEAFGDLAAEVEIVSDNESDATASAVETPLWQSLERITGALAPGASVVPLTAVFATDARFFRRKGATAYGYGLFSGRVDFAAYSSMFHGDDERVDQESLALTTALWEQVARDFLG